MNRRNSRSALGTARLVFEVQDVQQFVQSTTVGICCTNIRRVIRAENLVEIEVVISQALLYPQVAYGDMPNFAQPSAAGDADGCGGVRMKM